MATMTDMAPPRHDVTVRAPRRERGRWRWLAAFVVIAVGLAASVWVANYQPLMPGSASGASAGRRTAADLATGDSDRIVRYVHGEEFIYAFTLRNAGPVGVTIVDLPAPPANQSSMIRRTEVRVMTRPGLVWDRSDTVPFEPFHLAAGEERGLAIYNVFDDCEHFIRGSRQIYLGVTVAFRVFGVSRTTPVDLREQIGVVSPPDGRCPLARDG